MTESAIAGGTAGSDPAAAGRDAFARHAWQEAFDLLSRADRETRLSGQDLETLAEAAFFAGQGDARVTAKERAFRAYAAEGDTIRSAYVALDLASELFLRGKGSMASGWVRRAERLLTDQPETYAHGFLALAHSEIAKAEADIPRAIARADEALSIARRTDHSDLRATALATLAMLKIASGAADAGLALLEEAALDAVNGELSPIAAGITSCQMIAACRDLTDYQRATEWLEATDRWCEEQSVSGFPGICRVHRAEILALQGGWERAEQELLTATSELEKFAAIPPMADGLYAIGEIRRLRGDYPGAEEALRQANALGRSPQPALALIRFGQGRTRAAGAAIEAALAETTWDQWARARLLAALVEISVAAGDPARGRSAVDELARIVADYQSPALEAARMMALGRVLLAEGDPPAAIRELRAAMRGWRDVGAPYEVARVRAVLSAALRALGDEDGAELELTAARDEFKRLGAFPDLGAVETELRDIDERRSGRAEVRRTFMFTDIVGSTKLAEALGNAAWERMLRWHDDTLTRLIVSHGGSIVRSTGDGFFVVFESARRAVACAVEIQRALAEQGRASGFAPSVRIGLHTAAATQRGDDYSGLGVHVAARVAALADSGEVAASTETLAEAGHPPASETRDVEVKGVAGPVSVATLTWS